MEVVVQAAFVASSGAHIDQQSPPEFPVECALAPLLGPKPVESEEINQNVSSADSYIIDMTVRRFGDLVIADVDLVQRETMYLVTSQRLAGQLDADEVHDGLKAIIDDMIATLQTIPRLLFGEESVFAIRQASRTYAVHA
ncbi:MAG: hypothetical protein AAF318_15140 [Pseudomonadota bacterium]